MPDPQVSMELLMKGLLANVTTHFNEGQREEGLANLRYLFLDAVRYLGLRNHVTQDILLTYVEALYTVKQDVLICRKFEVIRLMAEERTMREKHNPMSYWDGTHPYVDADALAFYKENRASLEALVERDWLPNSYAV